MTQSPEDITAPTYPQYTNLALNEGLFTQLMSSVEHHLDKQFKLGRIKGTDYAKVYAGSIESVMQNTTQYLLGTMLFKDQQEKMAAEISLIATQEEQIEASITLAELEAEKLRYEINNVLPLQVIKLQAEIDLIDAQKLKVDQEVINLIAAAVLMVKQGDKIDKEIEFLTEKITSEQANTQFGIAAPGSLIGNQITLLKAQRYGFAADIRVKSAKLSADFRAIWQSVQETTATGDSELSAEGLKAISDNQATAAGMLLDAFASTA